MTRAAVLPHGASPEEVARAFGVSRESLNDLKLYADILLRWQRRINLISRASQQDLWVRHIADGLQLMPLLPPRTTSIVDLGSGAGIPGLVLAIALRREVATLDVHLVESNMKKAAFLREVARLTHAPVTVHAERIEDVAVEPFKTVPQVVTARALARLSRLVPMAEAFCAKGAVCLFHKGQDVDIELTETTKCWNIKVTNYPSRTQLDGTIVKIEEITRVPSN